MSFVEKLRESIKDRQLLNHPFYRDWMEGKLSMTQLRDYAQAYVPFVDAFPQLVSGVHNQCENPQARRQLLMNLQDEEGASESTSHPALWRGFVNGIGASDNQCENADLRAAAEELKATFLKLSRSSYAEGLAALYAYEYQIPEIAKAKIQGLIERYGIDSKEALEFFSVHQAADVFHSEACAEMISDIETQDQERALAAAQVATNSLWNFLSEVHGTC